MNTQASPLTAYRVRIGGEVFAAAGPRAIRRVPIDTADGRQVLEFTRTWTELAELPGPVKGDLRLEIEHRQEDGAEPTWQPLDRTQPVPAGEKPAGTDSGPAVDVDVEIGRALADASYAQLQQVAKVVGLKAQGTKDELHDAVALVLESPQTPVETRQKALALLNPSAV